MVIKLGVTLPILLVGLLAAVSFADTTDPLVGKWAGSLSGNFGGDLTMSVSPADADGSYAADYEYNYIGWGGCKAVLHIHLTDGGYRYQVAAGNCDRVTEGAWKLKKEKLKGEFPIPARITGRSRGSMKRAN